MTIDRIYEDDYCVVVPHGRIDAETSAEFSDALNDIVEKTQNIVIDLKNTEYISSSGLRVFLSLQKTLSNNGILTIRNVSEGVMDVFDLTGFTDILNIEGNYTPSSEDIKVIFFDVDGTLLSHTTGKVPESTKEAFKIIREKGIKTVIATGRYIVELEKLSVIDELEFDGYLTLNGNICLDENRVMFAGNPINPGEVEILNQIFKGGRIPFVFIGEKSRYINYVDDVVIQTQLATKGTIPDIGEYKGEPIYQCLSFVGSDIRGKLDRLLDNCDITSWNETGIDIIAKTGGKAAGIQKFLDKEGLKRSNVMAFGDGENDASMIQFAGIGVAMGNAGDRLKSIADYVTTSVDDDGIYNALKHYNLI